jgi:hypothetical protein
MQVAAVVGPSARRDALRDLVRHAPRRLRLRRALAAFAFHRLGLHAEFGYARQTDFVREQLGLSPGLWFDLVHAGALLTEPAVRRALRARRLEFSALVLLGRRLSPQQALPWLCVASHCSVAELSARLAAHCEPSPSTSPGEEQLVRLRLRLPASVHAFLHDSHELCSALVGSELSQPEALHYLLAEATSELPAPTTGRHPDPAELRPIGIRTSPNIRIARRAAPALGAPRDRQRSAIRLVHRLLELSQQELALECSIDDALREACFDELHHEFGDRRFVDFAQRELGLSPSSTDEKLRRARQRARRHPIELARELGQITQVKASILHGLCRCGVPLSALPHWIRFAAEHTVRALKRALAWARRAFREDLSRLYGRDYRPPSLAETRTSDPPLHQLACEFQLPPPGVLDDEPRERVELLLYREDHALLLDLTRALRERSRTRAPLWWQMLQILTLAREGLAQLANAGPPPRRTQREILERDRYRCQFPGCSERRVEIHHIEFRSHGGGDDPSNLVSLCPTHHQRGVHGHTIRVHGRASATQEDLIVDAGLDRHGHALLRYRGERLVFSSLRRDEAVSRCAELAPA